MGIWKHAGLTCVGVLVVAGLSAGQPDSHGVSPDTFLPAGNVRTSLAGVIRIYKVNEQGRIGAQPPGYPKTVADPSRPFEMSENEVPRIHEGFDLSSRDRTGRPARMEFRAGVYGTVVVAKPGIIVVQVDDRGNRMEYLHNSSVSPRIKAGTRVTPSTTLGETGNVSPSTGLPMPNMPIHLHVQARDKNGAPLYPDEVVRYAAQPSERRDGKAAFFVPMKWADPKAVKPFDWSAVTEDFSDRGAVRIGFDDRMGKGKAADPLVGTWKGTGTTDRGKRFSGTLKLAEGGAATYTGDLIQSDGSVAVATVTGTWSRAGDGVEILWKGAVQPVALRRNGNRLTDRIPNTPAGNLTLTFEKR